MVCSTRPRPRSGAVNGLASTTSRRTCSPSIRRTPTRERSSTPPRVPEQVRNRRPHHSPRQFRKRNPRLRCRRRSPVRRFLGEGGRKRVYLAHDERLDRDVAVAIIKTDGLDAQGLSRVHREAQAMARLGDQPNIVTIFDTSDDNGTPYIVSQYMAGGAVDGLELPLSVERTLEIAKEVCRGLAYAHAHGVVHRDLKPGNVWLSSDGTAKIGDFGLAVALDRSRMTMAGMMVGTVAYMAPEQALGGETTQRADLYALGAILYELVTGRPPFLGDDPTAVISQHINQPPVAPSWLTEAGPPDLEELDPAPAGEGPRSATTPGGLADLGPDMQGKGPLLGPIFPWVRQQPNFAEPDPLADPEAARFRLFDAFATFVRAMSNQTPLLIALDDLHWADKPSLLLLEYVARELSRMRVLIVCTYRDTDLSRTHPLSEALAVLNREAGFQRVAMLGLSRDEVAGYIRAAANVTPKPELLDRIFEETEGNPFFLSEVVNLLTQEGVSMHRA